MTAASSSNHNHDEFSRATFSAHLFGWARRTGRSPLSESIALCTRLSDLCTAFRLSLNNFAKQNQHVYLIKLYAIAPLTNDEIAQLMKDASSKQHSNPIIDQNEKGSQSEFPTHRVWIGLSSSSGVKDNIAAKIYFNDHKAWDKQPLFSSPPPMYNLFASFDFAIDRIAFQFHEDAKNWNTLQSDPSMLFISIPLKRNGHTGISLKSVRKNGRSSSNGLFEWDFDGINHKWIESEGNTGALQGYTNPWLRENEIAPIIASVHETLSDLKNELRKRHQEGILKTTASVLSEFENSGKRNLPFSDLTTSAFLSLGGGPLDAVAIVYSKAPLSPQSSGFVTSVLAAMTQAAGANARLPVAFPGEVQALFNDDAKEADRFIVANDKSETIRYLNINSELTVGDKIDGTKRAFSRKAFELIKLLIENEGQKTPITTLLTTVGLDKTDTKSTYLTKIISDAEYALKCLTGNSLHKWIKRESGGGPVWLNTRKPM